MIETSPALNRALPIEKLLYLVHATDASNKRAWYYVRVRPDKLASFKRKLMIGNLKLTEYGEIMTSGYGETVPEELREQIETRLKRTL